MSNRVTQRLADADKPYNGHIMNHRQPYADPKEVDWLRNVAKTLPERALVVILGAGPGIMATSLKDGNSSLYIILVDNDTCYYAMTHLADFGQEYINDVTPVIMDSAMAGNKYVGRPINMLIVDADHSEVGVASDIAAWLPKCADGCWIMFHDYDADGSTMAHQDRYPDVKIAVDRMMENANIQKQDRVGTSKIFQLK